MIYRDSRDAIAVHGSNRGAGAAQAPAVAGGVALAAPNRLILTRYGNGTMPRGDVDAFARERLVIGGSRSASGVSPSGGQAS